MAGVDGDKRVAVKSNLLSSLGVLTRSLSDFSASFLSSALIVLASSSSESLVSDRSSPRLSPVSSPSALSHPAILVDMDLGRELVQPLLAGVALGGSLGTFSLTGDKLNFALSVCPQDCCLCRPRLGFVCTSSIRLNGDLCLM